MIASRLMPGTIGTACNFARSDRRKWPAFPPSAQQVMETLPRGRPAPVALVAQCLTLAEDFRPAFAGADGEEDGPQLRAGGTPAHSLQAGDSVLNKSLTIVLPVHNAESRLRKNVRELLELASELTAKFGVLIIDDGSTDATYEVAEELAAHFPQVSVRRHRQCRGLGAAIDYVQRRVRSDAVIVHDGVTPIDPQQMRKLWRRWIGQSTTRENTMTTSADVRDEICDFANLPTIHAAMEQVHRQVIGFQLMTPPQGESAPLEDASPSPSDMPRTESPHAPHFESRAGVGTIPRLPRPKFLSALAEFALGE